MGDSVKWGWDGLPVPCFQTQDGGVSWTAIEMPAETRIEGVTTAGKGAAYFWGTVSSTNWSNE